jgi:hypothetical protein
LRQLQLLCVLHAHSLCIAKQTATAHTLIEIRTGAQCWYVVIFTPSCATEKPLGILKLVHLQKLVAAVTKIHPEFINTKLDTTTIHEQLHK